MSLFNSSEERECVGVREKEGGREKESREYGSYTLYKFQILFDFVIFVVVAATQPLDGIESWNNN